MRLRISGSQIGQHACQVVVAWMASIAILRWISMLMGLGFVGSPSPGGIIRADYMKPRVAKEGMGRGHGGQRPSHRLPGAGG
ncbi:hypothetical protein D3C80_1767850 [compost metagenome]